MATRPAMPAVIALVVVISVAAASVHAVSVSNVEMPEALVAGDQVLPVRGVALLRRYGLRIYAGALYMPDGVPATDYDRDVPKCLLLHYFVGISRERFPVAAATVLGRMYGPEVLEALQPRLDALNAVFRDVHRGDRYCLCYTPGTGTTLAFNGEPLVTIDGADFAAVYFSIWLGPDAASTKFRDALFGLR